MKERKGDDLGHTWLLELMMRKENYSEHPSSSFHLLQMLQMKKYHFFSS